MRIWNQYKGLRKENYYLFIGKIVTCLGSMVYPVLTLILNQKLGMNATEVATYTVVSGVAILPAIIIGGKLADKYNKKNIIIACDLVSISLYITCGVIPLSYITIALLIFASAFQMIEEPSYNALVADMTSTDKRERAYSLLYLGQNIGMIASPMIAGILFKNYLWLAFIITGLAIAFSTVLIFTKVKDITPVEIKKEDTYQQERTGETLLMTGYLSFLMFLGKIPFYYAAMVLFTFGEIFATISSGPYLYSRIPASHRGRIDGVKQFLNCVIYGILTMYLGICYDECGNVSAWLMLLGLLGMSITGTLVLIICDRKRYRELYKR